MQNRDRIPTQAVGHIQDASRGRRTTGKAGRGPPDYPRLCRALVCYSVGRGMFRLLTLLLAATLCGAQALYELSGQIRPEGEASVTLYGATHPFTTSTLTDESGR